MLSNIVEKPLILFVALLIVMVLGLIATFNIPVQMIPDLDARVVQIETRWPGATPQDIEQEILAEQERYLGTVPNLLRMTSVAGTGSAEVELEFPPGTDITETLVRVNNALSQVTAYPENVDEPRLEATSFSANSFIYMRIEPMSENPQGLNMRHLFDFVDDQVRPTLERVPGVARINVGGGSERQIRVLVDPVRLAERQITLPQLRDAIRGRNRNVSGGTVESGKRSYLVRTLGRFESLDEFSELVLRSDGTSQVLLKDVAEISAAHYRMRELATVNGLPAITLSVDRQPGSNVIDIRRDIEPAIAELNQYLLNPKGLNLAISSDDVRYVQASIRNVWQNLLLGAAMATAVLYLFLRSAPATLIGVIGVPICAVAAFLGLQLFGRTINVISLAGIAFSLGMTLDNTIVVLEGIDKRYRAGRSVGRAAVDTVTQVWPAILASTATTVIVFAPILFIENEAGQLFSDIAIAVSAAILASMLVAVLVVPALANMLIKPAPEAKPHQSAFASRVVGIVSWLIERSRRRIATLVSTIAVVCLVVWLLTPPAAYLPEGEEPKTFSRMIAPPGYNLDEMAQIADQVIAQLKPRVGAQDDDWAQRTPAIPPIKYFILWARAENLFMVAEPVHEEDIDALMRVLNETFRSFPGMRSFASRGSIISSNQGGTRSVNLDITGPTLEQIYAVARTALARSEQVFENPQIGSSPGSLSIDQPFIEVRPDWHRAAELGFSAADLGFSVAALSDGAFVDEYFAEAEKVDIFLYSNQGQSQNIAKLADLPLYAPVGEVIPLAGIVNLNETVGPDAVRRVDGQRTVTLNIVPERGVALEEAVARVRAEVVQAMQAASEIPNGVSISISGANDQLTSTQDELTDSYIIALALSYLILVAVFGHWGWPWVILTTVPLGIAGGIIGLTALNGFSHIAAALGGTLPFQPFDMITMLGFLILLGLVVNNPILIVHRMLSNLSEGMTAAEAVVDAVSSRIRPIMMSLLTTLAGLAPLVFIPGAGTELYRGVGAVVLFGLLLATLLSISFLPAMLVTIASIWQRRVQTDALRA